MMVGWHHRLNGHEFEQILGDSEGQGSLCVLQSMGLQRVGHDWATEQKQKPVCMLSCFICVLLFATLWTIPHQSPLSMGLSRQDWNWLPFPPPGDQTSPLMSPALAGRFFLPLLPPWKPKLTNLCRINFDLNKCRKNFDLVDKELVIILKILLDLEMSFS